MYFWNGSLILLLIICQGVFYFWLYLFLLLSLILLSASPDVFSSFLFVLDKWERRKLERMCLDSMCECVCVLCVYLVAWSDDCGFTFSLKGLHVMLMWLGRAAESSVVYTCSAGNVHMYSACYKLPQYTASMIGQWTNKHEIKYMLLYVLRGASVVALHAFVWEIKSIATKPTLQQEWDRGDVVCLICWVLSHNPSFVSIWLRNDATKLKWWQWGSWPSIRHDIITSLTHFTGAVEGWRVM